MRVTYQAKVQLDDVEHFQLDQKVQVGQEKSVIKRAPHARDNVSAGVKKQLQAAALSIHNMLTRLNKAQQLTAAWISCLFLFSREQLFIWRCSNRGRGTPSAWSSTIFMIVWCKTSMVKFEPVTQQFGEKLEPRASRGSAHWDMILRADDWDLGKTRR